MDLYIHHGRKSPDEKLDNWGPQGPRLKGVKGIHQTYGNPANVFFVDAAAKEEAKRLTGWEEWDDNALTMRWGPGPAPTANELVVCKGPDGVEMFYGDWGLM